MMYVDGLILVVGVLLLLGIASSKLSARLGIPVLVLFLVLGMLAGSEGLGGIEFENYKLAHGIGTIALALILFDGGLNTSIGAIRAVWRPSFALATVGVVITSVITGFAAAQILELSLMEGMLLGSIVGSTDAAAVFAVLRSGGVGLSKKMASLLEVESGSNDPMAIFLTIGCIEVIAGRMEFGPSLLWLFASQMVLGSLLGIALGYVALWIVNRIELKSPGLYPVLVMALCLSIFGITVLFKGSGFLAVYLAGIVMGNRRMVFQSGVRNYIHALAWLSQIIMFVMLGLLSTPSHLIQVTGRALQIGLVLVILARPVAVLCCLFPFRFRWNELLFISCVGLKGAVPIVLATFPLIFQTPKAQLYFNVVFFIVVISAAIQGGGLSFLAKKLGLRQPPDPDPPVRLEINSLRDVEGDVLDFLIRENSKAAGKQVKDLGLPEGVVIALITREDKVIPPSGRTRLEIDDHAIVILKPGTQGEVEEVFGEIPVVAANE